jgi:hypothetical protein
VLIATPVEEEEPQAARGQGTWATVRYARLLGTPVYIIWPNGELMIRKAKS